MQISPSTIPRLAFRKRKYTAPATCSVTSEAEWLPVLSDLLDLLPIQTIGRMMSTSKDTGTGIEVLRKRTLSRRGLHPSWSWQKAQALETALFSDPLGDPCIWTPGPNGQSSPCNTMESGGEFGQAESWLWLSGGTDWKGFQGGFRTVSEVGIFPTWVAFRVRIATPELSGAFLTLSSSQHTWGLADPILSFSYCGDEKTHQRRCFSVLAGNVKTQAQANLALPCYVEPEVVCDKPYDVAVWFDWNAKVMSVFIDGKRCLDRITFEADSPIRYAAIYNWRSGARTAFSELILGDTCPFTLPRSVIPQRSTSTICPSRLRLAPGRSALKTLTPTPAGLLFRVAFSSSMLVLFTALVSQYLLTLAPSS